MPEPGDLIMRWCAIPVVVALVWFVFTLTPFWALYDLARAVQTGDVPAVERQVNVRALRVSMTRQLTDAIRAGKDSETADRRGIGDAATALAMPIAEALITPRTVVDLLDDGWPQSLDPNGRQATATRTEGLRVDRIGRLIAYYLSSEMRGFGTVVIAVPPDGPDAKQFKIRLRMRNWSWHLVDIKLNAVTRDRIAALFARTARGDKTATEPERPIAP